MEHGHYRRTYKVADSDIVQYASCALSHLGCAVWSVLCAHLSCAHIGHAVMVDWAYAAMNRT